MKMDCKNMTIKTLFFILITHFSCYNNFITS